MIYIGWFNFDNKKESSENRNDGNFSLIVNATNPKKAVEKFENRLLSDDNWCSKKIGDEGIFSRTTNIYFESFAEFKKIPSKPVVLNYTQTSFFKNNVSGFISCMVPCGIDEEEVCVYQIEKTAKPFVIINSPID